MSLSNSSAFVSRWLKQSSLETPSLSHLKRVRRPRGESTSTLLLAPVSDWPIAPELPPGADLPTPYIIDVPRSAALTQKALQLKCSFWPTIYAPRKKFEPEPWTRGRLRWACEAVRRVVKEAEAAKSQGEVSHSSGSVHQTLND